MKISAVILSKDDSDNLESCLKSVDFCSEKLILKGQITDFSKQRNLGIEKASGDWILFIDTDEEVTGELKKEIVALLNYTVVKYNAYYIKRRDFFWGREVKFGETMKARRRGIIRLVKKNSGKWTGKVHEEYQPSGSVGQLNNYLNHYPHQTIKEFIDKINFYSSIRAEELYQSGKKFSILELIFFPLFKFKLTYFIYLGFLDGPAGFVYAFLMSFHSFLVRAKLFQIYQEHGLQKDR